MTRQQGPEVWRYTGQRRPPFAEEPGPGQRSVWDFPRPPRIEADPREVIVRAADIVIAGTTHSLRVLETASPPTYYLPRADVQMHRLAPSSMTSLCEWKGLAQYWTLVEPGRDGEPVAWSYSAPLAGFESLRDYVAFYPGRVDCFVDGARVRSQPGRFYAGWITPDVVGPFKGEPGTEGW